MDPINNIIGEGAYKTLISKILSIVEKNSEAHLFIDEFHFGLNGLDLLKQLKPLISENNYLWIACKKSTFPLNFQPEG